MRILCGCAAVTSLQTSLCHCHCNLASLALPRFVHNGTFDHQRLFEVTQVVARNLNKIIDLNDCPIVEAKKSNLRHRPIGIGVQGLADTFLKLRLPFSSPEAKLLNREIHAKPQSRAVKYRFKNPFLRFWFRFIFRERTAIETANFSYVQQVLYRDLSTYKGSVLEDFFRNLFKESKQFNAIGSYWEKDHDNEIDLVALNDLEKRIVIAEVKLNKDRLKEGTLKKKAEKLMNHYPGFQLECRLFSLDDASFFL